ncbi:ABC transporter permease [Lentibacillus sp. L22]|uniref:YhgE/Pip domain-containing protein n=1 Tax=Lentibacillus TaxID=175304 RepID=UPI0022B20DCF|nr:ABC transporter permease [Lentibacillus daqui]
MHVNGEWTTFKVKGVAILKNAITHILTHRLAIFGICIAIFYQFLFIICWQTGFGSIPNNTSHLKVAIINEDTEIGPALTNALAKQLPFRTKVEHSLPQAREKLERRTIQMIVRVPENFTQRVGNLQDKAQIDFFVNESNPLLIGNTVTQTAATVTAKIDQQFATHALERIMGKPNIPQGQIQKLVHQASQRVIPDVHKIHQEENMGNLMAPFMLGLAGFIAAMILQLNLFNASRMIGDVANKWQKFAVRNGINVVIAIICSFIASELLVLFQVPMVKGFFAIWGFQFLVMLAFIALTQIFVILFGLYGLFFNITILIIQTMLAGGSIPRVALPDFYYHLGKVMPMKYSVDGSFDLLLGGTTVSKDILALIIITIICIGICVLLTAIVIKDEKKDKPVQYANNEEEITDVLPPFHDGDQGDGSDSFSGSEGHTDDHGTKEE